MKAERETFDRLLAHFLADRVGATFEGHISGVTRVACSSSSTTPAPTASSRRAPSAPNIFGITRIAMRSWAIASGESYRLGDRVTVKLVEAVPLAGALRFELISEGRRDGAAPHSKRHVRPVRGAAARPDRTIRNRAGGKRRR